MVREWRDTAGYRIRSRGERRELHMRRRQGGFWFRVLAHMGAILLLFLVFSQSLYLGLQVHPVLGNIGLVLTVVLAAAYVYFGFIRGKRD